MGPIYLKMVNLMIITSNFSRAIYFSELGLAQSNNELIVIIVAFKSGVLLIKWHRIKKLAANSEYDHKY